MTIVGKEFNAQYKSKRKEITNSLEKEGDVRLFRLGEEEERRGFVQRLRDLPLHEEITPWEVESDGEILIEALDRGIVVDQYDFQLEDLAKTKRPPDYFSTEVRDPRLERYVESHDTWESGTIAEFPWKINGRMVRILDKEPFQELIYSRNRFVIPDVVHEKLSETKYAVAGLSVGGDTAYLMMLSGGENWVVADGGLLDVHDFNRVIGSKVEDIGVNHADRWKRMVLEHNPYLNVESYSKNIGDVDDADTVSYETFLEGAERVFEAVDKLSVKAKIRKYADVVMATDMGFAAKIDVEEQGEVFHGKLSDQEINDLLENPELTLEEKTEIAVKLVGPENIPEEYLVALHQAGEEEVPFWPQPGAPAFLAAAMLVAVEIGKLQGKTPKPESVIDLNAHVFEE
jgi:hypothetical protein